MNVLIVAKTRRGGGACVGGITEKGQSVRLIASDAAQNQHAGLEYEVGEVWKVDCSPDPNLVPPHVENIVVRQAQRLRQAQDVVNVIRRFMPPVVGGPENLFDGLTQATSSGGLYIARRTGLPHRSTMFWMPDEPLHLDCTGKRLRYRYPASTGGRTLTFVGFQEPLAEIPAGTLLRISLAHWWRPRDQPEEELRCFVQLSGWFLEPTRVAPPAPSRAPVPAITQATASRGAAAPGWLEQRALEVLKRTFGFSQFRPVQSDVIARVLQRQDALAVMPTGGGKSLCYQLPALLFEGLTVVVSPLVALMQDQVGQLLELGVSAAGLNHMVALQKYRVITDRVRRGEVKLLYMAPETLLRPETVVLLEQSRLTCLAIDEAHCISEWGHDFRPEYRQLQQLRRRFPQAVCLALTATATRRVREDIRRLLGIAAEGEFVASFNRPNLFLAIEPRQDELAQLVAFLEKRRGQSGIIYCSTRKRADELCAALDASGWPALPYHAGLEDDVRRCNQERFLRDPARLMVATIAFGMGINKSNVRFVVHAHLPGDLESYYQEIGRAGRDGLPAECLLLYSRADAMIQRHFIETGAESERRGREVRLQELLRFAEARDCRRRHLLAYFGEEFTPPCGLCDNCVHTVSPGELADVTTEAQLFLSCVKLTGQCFGPAHIIAILRGSRARRVLGRGHDGLSVFGAGSAHSTEQWRALADQFIRLGLLDQDLEFGGLRVRSEGWDVLHNNRKVLARPTRVAPAASRPHDSGTLASPAIRGRCREIGERFAAGQNIEQIARHYNILPETVIQHLAHFREAGGTLDSQRVLQASRLSESERARVLSQFERLGCTLLAPVHTALAGTVSYEELHLLRLYFLNGNA